MAQTKKIEPMVTAADGAGAEEEVNYQQEAEELADSFLTALDDEEISGSGVETDPGLSGPGASESVSPAATTEGEEVTPAGVESKSEQTPVTVPGEEKVAEQPVVAAPQQQPQVEQKPQVAPPQQAAAQAQPVSGAENVASGAAVGGTEFIDQVRSKLNEGREIYTKALSESVYKMTEEEAQEVLTSPEKVLPQLAARVHLEVVQNVLGTMAQTMPGVISGLLQAQKQNTEVMDQFFQKWPQLDRVKDKATVYEVAKVYRQLNPQATMEEMFQAVGATAVVKLGKLPAAAQAAPAQPAKAPAYTPARNAPTVMQPTQTMNPWEAMAEVFDE